MRKTAVSIFVAIMAVAAFSVRSQADVQAGISIGDGGVQGFYLAIGEFFKAPENEVVVVHERKIPDDEIPVVYFIARRARTTPEVIIKMRLGGESWMDISAHFGITADIYYVPVKHHPGPPYGKAYGHFKKRKRQEWKKVMLTDAEIINFVNLRFISEHYGYSPDEVIKMRGEGRDFVEINGHAKQVHAEKMKSEEMASKDKAKGKSDKGKNKGKKK